MQPILRLVLLWHLTWCFHAFLKRTTDSRGDGHRIRRHRSFGRVMVGQSSLVSLVKGSEVLMNERSPCVANQVERLKVRLK